jgi:O-antigen/teichoic acid export membrane protein
MITAKKESRSLSFVKNTSGVMATKVALVIIKMAIGILTARILGPNGKGIFVLAIQMPGTLTVLSNLSIGEALIYNIGQKKISRNKILGNILLFTSGVSILTFGAYFYLLPYLSKNLLKNIDLSILKISSLLIPLIILDLLSLSTLKGFKKFKLYNGLTLLSRGFILCSLFTALIILGTGIKGAVSAYVLVFFLNILVFIIILFFLSERKISFSWKELKSLVVYGLGTHIAVVLSELEYRFDIFILNFFLSPVHVGIYSVGVTMAQLMWYISNSVNTVLFPEISSISRSKAAQFIPQVCRNTFFICGILGLFLVTTGYFLIRLLYGIEFILAYSVFLILLPGLMMDAIFRILSSYFKGTGRPLIVSKVVTVTLCLNLFLNFILIPLFGIHGAAISSLISYSLNAIILLMYFQRDRKFKLFEFLLIKKSDLKIYSKLLNRVRKEARILPPASDIDL